MRRFLTKLLLLALLAAGIAAALALGAYTEPVSKRFGLEVFRAIRVCSEARPEATTLVLGDSVANQIFSLGTALPPDVAVATCNQSITPIGNRLLLERWLALNPQTKDVVYVALPGSLCNDGARLYTFHYFLHPFAETGLLDEASPETRKHLADRFGRWVMDSVSVRHLLYRNDRLYELYEDHLIREPPPRPSGMFPPMCEEQLRAMGEACARAGARFRVACPPMPRRHAPTGEARARFAAALSKATPCAAGYFDTLQIEPDESFRDEAHLTTERLDALRDGLRAKLLERGATWR